MIDFETYLMYKLILAVFGVFVMFPLAMWWFSTRRDQRNTQRKEQNDDRQD